MNPQRSHSPQGQHLPLPTDPEARHRPDRPGKRAAIVSIRLIVSFAAVALTTAAVLSMGAVSERNTREALTREIEARLLLEARNLALLSTEALLADFPELTLHPLVKEMKLRQPELGLVVVLDHADMVVGDPDARQLGAPFTPRRGLKPIKAVQALAPDEAMMSDAEMLVASAPVRHRDGRRIGTAMVGLRRDYLDRMLTSARRQQSLVLGLLVVVGIVSAFFLMSHLLRPVGVLRAGIERIGQGDLDTPLVLRDRTEFGLLADAVNRMASELKRAQAEMVERERLAHEVELARQIQTSLLPAGRRESHGFVIEGSQRAAAEVGGDYYDFFALPDGKIGIAVADVAGKGLAGCLVMSMLSVLLRALRTTHASPAAMLGALDERLSETLQPGSFVTMFYALLNPATGEMVYASAGHSPLLVYRRGIGTVEWFKTKGIPLGAVRGGVIKTTLKDHRITLGEGDLVVQFTDGVNEAFDPTGQHQFGFERMERVVAVSASGGANAVITALHQSVSEWVGSAPALDDETILIVCREAVRTKSAERSSENGLDPLRCLEEAMKRGRRLKLIATLDNIIGIERWVGDCLAPLSLSESELSLVSTALYEACTNIAEHGYAQDRTQTFELWWVSNGDPTRPPGIVGPAEIFESHDGSPGYFLIRDHGATYQPEEWKQTDFADPNVWRRRRGFGLDIIHRTMKEVSYHPGTPEGNITIMTFVPGETLAEEKEARRA